MTKKLFISLIIASSILTITTAKKTYNISQSKLNAISAKYGEKARKRAEIWDSIIQNAKIKIS